MAVKKCRNMKVYEQSGYHYKATPTITLKRIVAQETGLHRRLSYHSTMREWQAHHYQD